MKKYYVIQTKLKLFVAESHYFDEKGNRQVTLTDVEEFAEKMTLAEANHFVSNQKNSKDYLIDEAPEDEEEEDDE